MKWKENEFAEPGELAVAPPANKIEVSYGYVVSIGCGIDKLRIVNGTPLLQIGELDRDTVYYKFVIKRTSGDFIYRFFYKKGFF
ncbi:hypothetical protein [Mucilaginibacter xinganensis]|uniref:hypothetical protein n=1 Tax=Mucilaginibacter xinganensis TaxID=1234841 RepID=UPI000B986480|nr:hypothetical protein [Mucilaginibacter xinganensis]